MAEDAATITLGDLDGHDFATVPEAAPILRCDERTLRAAIRAGDVPAVRVGAFWKIPTSWLRQAARAS